LQRGQFIRIVPQELAAPAALVPESYVRRV